MLHFLSMMEGKRICNTYLLLNVIGEGSTSTVYKALCEPSGRMVAIKCFKAYTKEVEREIRIHKDLTHPNIAKFYEFISDEDGYYIVMELAEGGTLLEWINFCGFINEIMARKLFVQMVSALDYLHNEMNIIHRDMKPDNILIDADYNIKIIDFGLSKRFDRRSPIFHKKCGSVAYVAPEIISDNCYSLETDIWSIGVILYALINGCLPFYDQDLAVLFRQITEDEPMIKEYLSYELKDLLLKLFLKDPKERITLEKIKEHPFVRTACVKQSNIEKCPLCSLEGHEYTIKPHVVNTIRNKEVIVKFRKRSEDNKLLNTKDSINSHSASEAKTTIRTKVLATIAKPLSKSPDTTGRKLRKTARSMRLSW